MWLLFFVFVFLDALSLRVWEIDFCILQQIQEYYPVNSPSLDSDAFGIFVTWPLIWNKTNQDQLSSNDQLQDPHVHLRQPLDLCPLSQTELDGCAWTCVQAWLDPQLQRLKVLLRPSCMVNSVLWTCSRRLCWILQRIYIILDLSLIL